MAGIKAYQAKQASADHINLTSPVDVSAKPFTADDIYVDLPAIGPISSMAQSGDTPAYSGTPTLDDLYAQARALQSRVADGSITPDEFDQAIGAISNALAGIQSNATQSAVSPQGSPYLGAGGATGRPVGSYDNGVLTVNIYGTPAATPPISALQQDAAESAAQQQSSEDFANGFRGRSDVGNFSFGDVLANTAHIFTFGGNKAILGAKSLYDIATDAQSRTQVVSAIGAEVLHPIDTYNRLVSATTDFYGLSAADQANAFGEAGISFLATGGAQAGVGKVVGSVADLAATIRTVSRADAFDTSFLEVPQGDVGVPNAATSVGATVNDVETGVTGAQWQNYFANKYGAENVTWAWPANQGFVYGADTYGALDSGQFIGRIGPESGTFAAPLGTAPETLSLNPGTDLSNYNVYQVNNSIAGVRMGPAAPAFDMPGYGMQLQLPASASQLIKDGYLIRVTNH